MYRASFYQIRLYYRDRVLLLRSSTINLTGALKEALVEPIPVVEGSFTLRHLALSQRLVPIN